MADVLGAADVGVDVAFGADGVWVAVGPVHATNATRAARPTAERFIVIHTTSVD